MEGDAAACIAFSQVERLGLFSCLMNLGVTMQRVLIVIVWTSDDAWAYALDDEQLLAFIAAMRQTTKPTMLPSDP